MMIMMFIGASPGSTGGGVKTSTIGVGIAYIRTLFFRRDKVTVFYRSIPSKIIEKSFLILFLSFAIVSLFFFVLLSIESKNSDISVFNLLFETVSAFGTVGLSMGITAKLSVISRYVLAALMFIGRVGPITLIVAMSKKKSKGSFDYPEEDIMVG
jgi:trk system potassium uptake protein TrkH